MRSRIHAVVLPSEVGGFADEVRDIFRELGGSYGADALSGECTPPIDVYETEGTIEISMDLPGVEPDAVQVVMKGTIVLIAGEKMPRRGRGDSTFHLVERGFGRFARTVRISTACNAAEARAALVNGELRVTLPKVTERRGRAIRIPLST